MIEDLGYCGRGFISENYLEDLLGNNAEARRALGVQVRIFIPTQCVFKGMLMRKRDINGEPIQLNESLPKIKASRNDESSEHGHIVITRTFPSNDNFQGVGRLFHNEKAFTKSFRDNLRGGKTCKLSSMYQRVLLGLGVPKNAMKHYIPVYLLASLNINCAGIEQANPRLYRWQQIFSGQICLWYLLLSGRW